MRFKLFSFLLIMPMSVVANSKSDIQSTNASLKIQPKSCIVNSKGQECSMTVVVNWQSDVQIETCLYLNDKKLICWDKVDEAHDKLQVSLSKTSTFYLKNSNNEVIAKHKIFVSTTEPQNYRRKLRADWSFF